METLFVFSRPPIEDELRLLNSQKDAKVLLLGTAVFTSPAAFKSRTVMVLAEDIDELGARCPLPTGFKTETSSAVIDTLLTHRIFNF